MVESNSGVYTLTGLSEASTDTTFSEANVSELQKLDYLQFIVGNSNELRYVKVAETLTNSMEHSAVQPSLRRDKKISLRSISPTSCRYD